jgi:hypothetical protein
VSPVLQFYRGYVSLQCVSYQNYLKVYQLISLPECASCENVELNFNITDNAAVEFMIGPLKMCAIETQRTCDAVQATVHKHTHMYGSFRLVLSKKQDNEYISTASGYVCCLWLKVCIDMSIR